MWGGLRNVGRKIKILNFDLVLCSPNLILIVSFNTESIAELHSSNIGYQEMLWKVICVESFQLIPELEQKFWKLQFRDFKHVVPPSHTF